MTKKQKPHLWGRCLPQGRRRRIVDLRSEQHVSKYSLTYPMLSSIRRSFPGFGAITRTFHLLVSSKKYPKKQTTLETGVKTLVKVHNFQGWISGLAITVQRIEPSKIGSDNCELFGQSGLKVRSLSMYLLSMHERSND